MCWCCPSVCLSVCPVPPPRGKTKRPTNTKLGRKGPWDTRRSRGQRSRSRRLIALLVKNPHNFAACCPINLIFGRWRKDPLPLCTDLESPKTACTYSTARTAPQRAAPQRPHPLVIYAPVGHIYVVACARYNNKILHKQNLLDGIKKLAIFIGKNWICSVGP